MEQPPKEGAGVVAYRLSKGCVKEIVEGAAPHKVCLVQVSETNRRPGQRAMVISDGVWTIDAIRADSDGIHDFDVIALLKYRIEVLRKVTLVFVKKFRVVFTNLGTLIGAPVGWPEQNLNARIISPNIPSSAVLVEQKLAPGRLPTGSLPGAEQFVAAKQSVAASVDEGEAMLQVAERAEKAKDADYDEDEGNIMPLRALGLLARDWKVKVKLVKKSKPKTFKSTRANEEGVLMPLEFVDRENTLIAATLFGEGVGKFDPILAAGRYYYVSRGKVKLANKKFTSIENDFTITLDENSEITAAPDDGSIETKLFQFVPLRRIRGMPTKVLVDVLGIVHSVSDVCEIQLKETKQTTKKKVVQLFDEDMEPVRVTLWRELAEQQFQPGQIVGFKDMYVGEYKGKVLSSTKSSLIKVEPEDPRVAVLKEM